ncbi:MAG: hypothetical protein CM15mP102_21660 [Flavobacteriales bacterium]|nr:MAG: hypothetical protein CM15mP102_21660 [Flavobacteriales bacterium]
MTEIKIIDDNWNELEMGMIGEVAIKSESNMLGYWGNDEATSDCMNDEGWFKSSRYG